MILKNKLTHETLDIPYSEFRKRFAKEIQESFESYRQTQLKKYPYKFQDDNSMKFNFYFELHWNLRIVDRGLKSSAMLMRARLTSTTKKNNFGNSNWYIEKI